MTREGDATRARLISAAKRLVQAQGYHGVGVAAILEAAEAPRSSFYHHFPGGKPELVGAAVQSLAAEITARFDAALAKGLPPDQYLARLCADTQAWLIRNNWQEGALLSVLSAAPVEDLREVAVEAQQSIADGFARYLNAFEVGEADRVAVVVLAALDGAVQAARVSRDGAPLQAVSVVLGPLLQVER